MEKRVLETTPDSCRMALNFTKPNSMDDWLSLDALAAHELLALVREFGALWPEGHFPATAIESEMEVLVAKASPWLE